METVESGKKAKNLVALCILLGGLFIGSLFVDVIQLVRGEGFSRKAIMNADVIQAGGKTWVAFSEPIVNVRVFTDTTCETCDVSEVLVWMRKMLPTISAKQVDYATEAGKQEAQKFGIKTLPAFVFSAEVKNADFYSKAQELFVEKDSQFVFNVTELGVPVGKYLELPKVAEDDIQIGNKDSKVTVVEFSDFQCPFCSKFHESIQQMLTEYGDQIRFVFKHFPLSFHAQATNAALASECANEQGKFKAYADKLFGSQKDWQNTTGTAKFKAYAAQLGLSVGQFNQCLDSKKYQEKVDRDMAEGGNFGISGTPAVFINDQFKNGVVPYENLKATIDAELAK